MIFEAQTRAGGAPGHPFYGMELTVLRQWHGADGQLRLWVELPIGRCQSMAASRTGLEAPPEDAPRTHGLAASSLAMHQLVEVLENRRALIPGQRERQLILAPAFP